MTERLKCGDCIDFKECQEEAHEEGPRRPQSNWLARDYYSDSPRCYDEGGDDGPSDADPGL